jgi:hypothetical protein
MMQLLYSTSSVQAAHAADTPLATLESRMFKLHKTASRLDSRQYSASLTSTFSTAYSQCGGGMARLLTGYYCTQYQ